MPHPSSNENLGMIEFDKKTPVEKLGIYAGMIVNLSKKGWIEEADRKDLTCLKDMSYYESIYLCLKQIDKILNDESIKNDPQFPSENLENWKALVSSHKELMNYYFKADAASKAVLTTRIFASVAFSPGLLLSLYIPTIAVGIILLAVAGLAEVITECTSSLMKKKFLQKSESIAPDSLLNEADEAELSNTPANNPYSFFNQLSPALAKIAKKQRAPVNYCSTADNRASLWD